MTPKNSPIKKRSTLLEPPCPKLLYRKLTVSWLGQQRKHIGLKIKKSGCKHDILHIWDLFFFFLLR